MIVTHRNVALFATALAAVLAQACSNGQSTSPAAPEGGKPVVEAPANLLSTKVQGAPADGATVAADTLSFTFNVEGDELAQGGLVITGYECRLGDSDAFKPCGGAPFVISGLRHGEAYSIAVRGVLKNEATGVVVYAAESSVHFKVDLAPVQSGDSDTTQQPIPTSPGETRALASKLLVGNGYLVEVPEGQHVTEYSSSKTTGLLSLFRILPESDPYYLNNFNCARDWDRMVASIAPAGQPLTYCHSTPTREAYKTETEFRLAHNHVEIATDTNMVTSQNQERLAIAVYDSDFEYMNVRSRYWNACQNSERNYITVPMINNFFLGVNPERVNFWYCDTYQTDVDGSPVLWRVGAFTDVDHMDWNCPECKYSRAIEMTYQVRANAGVFLPEQFARTAQERILSVLKKLTP